MFARLRLLVRTLDCLYGRSSKYISKARDPRNVDSEWINRAQRLSKHVYQMCEMLIRALMGTGSQLGPLYV